MNIMGEKSETTTTHTQFSHYETHIKESFEALLLYCWHIICWCMHACVSLSLSHSYALSLTQSLRDWVNTKTHLRHVYAYTISVEWWGRWICSVFVNYEDYVLRKIISHTKSLLALFHSTSLERKREWKESKLENDKTRGIRGVPNHPQKKCLDFWECSCRRLLSLCI